MIALIRKMAIPNEQRELLAKAEKEYQKAQAEYDEAIEDGIKKLSAKLMNRLKEEKRNG